jgi:DNA-binding NtrC family response regulator
MNGKHRVLIVEADATVRDACALAADRLGCVAYSTAYIDDFKVVLEQLQPSLIVLDLNMLGRGGADLLNYLVDSRSDARVLLLSGMNQRVRTAAQILASSLGLSGVSVLQKPEHHKDLEQALQRSIRDVINVEPAVRGKRDAAVAAAGYAH